MLVAALGQHRLGVELHAVDGRLAVPQAHDHAALVRDVTSSSSGTVSSTTASEWYRVAMNGWGTPVVERAVVVLDLRRLAVHQLVGVRDGRPERLGDGLVPEADAEQRLVGRESGVHDVDRDAGGGRGARAGRQQHGVVLGDARRRPPPRRRSRCARRPSRRRAAAGSRSACRRSCRSCR